MSSSEISNLAPIVPPATAVADIQQGGQSAVAAPPETVPPVNSATQPAVNVPSPGANNAQQDHQLKASVDAANSMLQAANRSIEFQVDQSTKQVVVKIVDVNTGTTLMQMPSEQMLNFTQNLIDHGGDKGSIIQQKA